MTHTQIIIRGTEAAVLAGLKDSLDTAEKSIDLFRDAMLLYYSSNDIEDLCEKIADKVGEIGSIIEEQMGMITCYALCNNKISDISITTTTDNKAEE